ncbi:MAG: DUF1844 domain-containing protein [Candidatus Brocadiae bacterium]|nr:DUF1844 domain-containing protein [Candidatus Brocadiia bacterium]
MQEDNESKEDLKLHVDEDWKKSVAEEKAKLREEDETHGQRPAPEQARPQTLPKPSMEVFLAGLWRQTLMALGEVESPITGKKEKNAVEAAYLIDTIAMLQEKTKGNLTSEESSYVQGILTDLRMRYVRVAEQPGKASEEQEGTQQS